VTDTFVASSGLADVSTTGTPSITIPSVVQGGDLMLAMVSSAQATITFPAGWTVLRTINPPSGGSGMTVTVAYRKAAGTVGSPSSDNGSAVTATPGTTGSKTSMTFAAWRGIDATSPIMDFDTIETDSGTGLTSFATPTVTTSTDNAIIITGYTDKNSVVLTIGSPTGYTTRASEVPASGTGKCDSVMASKQAGAAGAYGGEAFTTTASPAQIVTWTIALAPLSTTTILKPISDITATNVTGVTDNTNKYANVDETTTSTGDYVEAIVTGVYRAGLTTVTDPGTTAGWTVEFALGLGSGASSTTWTAKLIQNTTTRETWTETVTADPTEIVHALNPTNVAAITYASGVANDLRLELTLTAAS
jgi:hypothetical protein